MSALPSHRCGSSPCGPSRCRPQQRIAAAGQPQPSQPGWRNLRNADLSFTTVRGASLRGADLRGSRLFGTELSNANLSGAQLDPKALEQSHWQGTYGISRGLRSHASLHNACVEAAQANRWAEAERLFSEAITAQPTEPLSWVARGIMRCKGKRWQRNHRL